jgi:gluconokinase
MMERFVIMGVSGCGKSSIGAAFAAAIGGKFIDGDDLHPATNRAKMAAGNPLTDEDRAPWLVKVGQSLRGNTGPIVIGCSALKRCYRDTIRAEAGQPVMFMHLAGSPEVLAKRMAARTDHFMPPSLLASQLAALEPPSTDEHSITVDIDQTPQAILAELLTKTHKGRLPRP